VQARQRPVAHFPGMNASINSARRGLRALVADDKPFIREVTAKLLKMAGIEDVTLAMNGREAVAEIVRADPPIDLVFLDLMMPDMDGV
jgi:CheY-like chemotaxis protein